jgi:proton-translocating NADH-quinone oxidoreductase chain L
MLPLLGFLSGSMFGFCLGEIVLVSTTFSVFIPFLISLFIFYDVVSTGVVYKLNMSAWVVSENLSIDWCFCFDSLTLVMLIVVTSVSTAVHVYSIEYMSEDPHLIRFMSYLSLFTFFMLLLISANNFLQMFVGWEGVGLCSYLLINFWFTRIQANKAAIKAMLINRVGDFFLLLSLFSISFVFNSLDYDVVFGLAPLAIKSNILIGSLEVPGLDLICFLLFLGAMGKSAQVGLHTWLPDAMEGPTPVSALIHAATMVTAGVFLIVRCSYFFELSPNTLSFIVFVGSITSFFAATTGLFQNDIKRIIAYSTCSQLGYMVFACGLSSYDLGLFHLSNHAFFKALLFLGAGSVIHAMADEQDIRRMGGLRRILPFSYSVMVIGSLALVGFPFLTGFYSKDAILEVAYAKYTVEGHFSYMLGVLAAFCTSFYSTRLLFLVFLSEPNGSRLVIINAKEGSWLMGLPLFILSILTIVLGFMTRDLFIGFGTHFWGTSIFILPQNYTLVDIEFIPLFYKLLPLLISIAGTFFAYALYSFGLKFFYRVKTENSSFRALYNFLVKKWYFDRIYNEIFVQSILYFSYDFVYKDLDRGLIERMGPLGVTETCSNVSKLTLLFQTGLLSHYLFSFFLILLSFGFGWVVSSSLFLILSLTTVLFIYTFNEEIS